MANTLTGLIVIMYEALNNIAQERIGFIPAVQRNADVARAAIGQTVRVPVVPAVSTLADNTPAVNAPDTGDEALEYIDLGITNSKHRPIRFNGEETLALNNSGNYRDVVRQRFAQGFRTLNNAIELDLFTTIYKASSRAHGTAGTTPFGTADDMSDFAGVHRIFDDNGVPKNDIHLVLGNSAMQNIRGKQVTLFRANEAGSDELLRNGMVARVQGFDIHQSGQITAHTKGTGTSYQSNFASGYGVGTSSIALDTGSGTVLAGDVVTFAGDTNKYVVNTGVAAAGSIAIGKPGTRATLADNVAMTIGNNYTPNVAFQRNGVVLATRLPAMPDGGDSAVDVQTITDPVTGIVYEAALYKQYLQNVVHLRVAWGQKVINSEFVATLMG